MKKKIVVLGIQLMVVAAVLILTVVSYAWYTANSSVRTENVIITSSSWTNVTISGVIDDAVPYMGQTGTGYIGDSAGGADAPYRATKTMDLNCSPVGDNYAIFAELSSVTVTKSDGEVLDESNTPNINGNFTWRLCVLDENGGVLTVLNPSENGFVVDTNNENSYYYVTEETVIKIRFEIYFLDPISFAAWNESSYDAITPFAFSDYLYMGSVFGVKIQLGLDLAPSQGGDA